MPKPGTRPTPSSRRALEDRVRTQRQWASVGVAKARRSQSDNDKAQRGFKLNRTESLAAKVRISEKRLARLDADAVEKPWEPWTLRMTFGGGGAAATWSPGSPARSSSGPGGASDPSTWRCGGPTASRSPGPTGRGRRR